MKAYFCRNANHGSMLSAMEKFFNVLSHQLSAAYWAFPEWLHESFFYMGFNGLYKDVNFHKQSELGIESRTPIFPEIPRYVVSFEPPAWMPQR